MSDKNIESLKKLYGDKEITLSDDQQEGFKQAQEFMLNKEQFFSIIGPAGSGKTTLMRAIAAEAANRRWDVVLAAPTHKAAKQLSLSCEKDAKTVHKVLGISMQENDFTGELEVKSKGINELTTNTFLIIDEGSMFGEKLYEFTKEDIEMKNVKILFVGDIAQLNPVNEEPSIVVDPKTCPWPLFALTKIHRQAADNPIIALATKIRTATNKLPIPETHKNGDSGIFILSHKAFAHKMLEACSKNADDRYIGYENYAVDEAAKYIRLKKYGKDAQKYPYLVGETLIVNERYTYKTEIGKDFDDKPIYEKTVIENNTEFEVERVLEDDGLYRVIGEVDGATVEFNALRSYQHRKRYIEEIARQCKIDKQNEIVAKPWGPYHEAKAQIADLRSASSLTIHKSQGSTFRDTYLNMNQIRACHDFKERQRLFYVAVTRSSRAVYITGV